MILASCANCCYNGLQYGSIGMSAGYCVEHRCMLRRADETTCGRHFRKDLMVQAAETNQSSHASQFSRHLIVTIREKRDVTSDDEFTERNANGLLNDPVGRAVAEYGFQGSKIHTLASLRFLPGVRPELAWVSLGRAYARRCVANGGRWTSGVHMAWWIKERLKEEPRIEVHELRYHTRMTLSRQEELARWSLVMLRLTLLGDVGSYALAQGDAVGELANLPEEAAAAASTSYSHVRKWVSTHAMPLLNRVLSEQRYQSLCEEVHRDPA